MQDVVGQTAHADRFRVLSGSWLKTIALASMLIDHTAFVLLSQIPVVCKPFVVVGSVEISWYVICRWIGRLAFPIYCFLITEGYLHTRDKRRYGASLLLFALLSEIPWNLEHTGKLFYDKQNVFFTLLLGYLAIWAYDAWRDDWQKRLVGLIGIFLASLLLNADYGCKGMGLILMLYVLRNQKVAQAIIGGSMITPNWPQLLAFVPINMYNGERGFIKGNLAKYAFYAAYPIHLMLLYLIRAKLFGY